MVRHLYGYSDIADCSYEKEFDFYQNIGCRKNPACIVPCSKKNNELPYYRDYSEAVLTRLYFKGFSFEELCLYARSYSHDPKCVGCAHPNVRRIVKCRSF